MTKHSNPYIRLADRISEVFHLEIPAHSENSAFVRLFAKLLTQKEAILAAALSDELFYPDEAEQETFYHLAKKGILYEELTAQGKAYKLMPFVPGIFEAVGSYVDTKEMAEYLSGYTEEMRHLKAEYTAASDGASYKTIPVNYEITLEISQASFSEIMGYIDHNESFGLMDCICRTIRKEEGRACGHPITDMCMIIGDYAEYYIRMGHARRASREEMIEVLRQAEAASLYHQIYPIEKTGSAFVCNCCTCGCMFMGLADRISHALSYKGKVTVDRNRCTLCGKCISCCPENVFTLQQGQIAADPRKCFECGMCSLVCASGAIVL